MKNRQIAMGILVIVMVFGFMCVGCPISNDSSQEENGNVTQFEGVWKKTGTTSVTFTFNRSSYTEELSQGTISGSFEFTETTITFKPTSSNPAGAPLSNFTMDYQFSENPTTLTLSRSAGNNGSGAGNYEGGFIKQ